MSGTEPKHWYEREADRLAWELDEFERQGLTANVSHDNEGRLVVTTKVHFRGEPAEISATFPHGYPHFPPTVVGEARLLDRHQDPVGLNYCLLEDHENHWHPSRSAGQLIGKNLRALLKDTEAGTAAIREGEADMAEPVGAHFLYDREVVILVAEPFLVDELNTTKGAMTLKRGPDRARILAEAEGIGSTDPGLVDQFASGGTEVVGRWVALDRPPRPEDFPQSILEAIDAVDSSILFRLDRQLRRKKGLPFSAVVVGLTFIEQGPTREEQRRNWMFAEIEHKRGYKPRLRRLLLPTQALSRVERQRRIPELAGLDEAHVVVIGAGSLGAPVALELAKAGVGRLDLIDPDRYDVNNAVRHVISTRRAGEMKAEETAAQCALLNPFVAAHAHGVRLGNSVDAHALLDSLLETATVAIDTTGAATVGRFVAEQARAAGVPTVVSGLTAASYGGDLLLLRPDGPCFDCFALAQDDSSMPSPAVGPRSAVTPIGCRHPAFSGAGFEATELAAVTARLVVRETGLTQYPRNDANWVVLNFRGDPRYQEGRIEVHPNCDRHG